MRGCEKCRHLQWRSSEGETSSGGQCSRRSTPNVFEVVFVLNKIFASLSNAPDALHCPAQVS